MLLLSGGAIYTENQHANCTRQFTAPIYSCPACIAKVIKRASNQVLVLEMTIGRLLLAKVFDPVVLRAIAKKEGIVPRFCFRPWDAVPPCRQILLIRNFFSAIYQRLMSKAISTKPLAGAGWSFFPLGLPTS
jgi:hypothetical protein